VRLALVIVLAGCSPPASVPAHVLAGHPDGDPCDEAAWQHLASSPLRARVGDRDVIVVDERIAPDCLRASPSDRAAVVGIATEPLGGTPAADGWLRVETDAPWGRVEAYGHVEPTPVELPRTGSDDSFRWPYDGLWR
jgi:hypothetical protein